MSSILTNNGAMVALQTLKSINSNMEMTQSEISTGKSVANAKDNSAVWAISKVMEADVAGFKEISNSLNLGSSTVAVARQAAETVTDLLTDVKGKIVAAQEENVDRDKIQQDITALRDQISAVVGAAQFNGMNLLQNTDSATDSDNIKVLASLDRSSSGVAASDITVAKQDLGAGAATYNATSGDQTDATGSGATIAAGAKATAVDFSGVAAAHGNGYVVESGSSLGFSENVGYVARQGDTLEDVTNALVDRMNVQAKKDGQDLTFSAGSTAGVIEVTNNTGAVLAQVADNTTHTTTTGNTVGGGLEMLGKIDVSTDEGTEAALQAIEGLIQTSIDAAASFGSVQGRIDTQEKFVSSLSDALKSGIGTLVDADMEETSARLQALQVQQQLGTQALSIANRAPQSLLSLFR